MQKEGVDSKIAKIYNEKVPLGYDGFDMTPSNSNAKEGESTA